MTKTQPTTTTNDVPSPFSFMSYSEFCKLQKRAHDFSEHLDWDVRVSIEKSDNSMIMAKISWPSRSTRDSVGAEVAATALMRAAAFVDVLMEEGQLGRFVVLDAER